MLSVTRHISPHAVREPSNFPACCPWAVTFPSVQSVSRHISPQAVREPSHFHHAVREPSHFPPCSPLAVTFPPMQSVSRHISPHAVSEPSLFPACSPWAIAFPSCSPWAVAFPSCSPWAVTFRSWNWRSSFCWQCLWRQLIGVPFPLIATRQVFVHSKSCCCYMY